MCQAIWLVICTAPPGAAEKPQLPGNRVRWFGPLYGA